VNNFRTYQESGKAKRNWPSNFWIQLLTILKFQGAFYFLKSCLKDGPYC
jgi:hypothetical protein